MIIGREKCEIWRDMTGECCVVCGRFHANKHHEPQIGTGKRKEWNGALLSLCGSGTTGCHGLRHARKLELAFDDERGWLWRGESSKGKSDKWQLCHDDDFWNALGGLYG